MSRQTEMATGIKAVAIVVGGVITIFLTCAVLIRVGNFGKDPNTPPATPLGDAPLMREPEVAVPVVAEETNPVRQTRRRDTFEPLLIAPEQAARSNSSGDIFTAVANGTVRDVQNLVEKGTDWNVNAKTSLGETLLHRAALYNSNVDVLQYLISKGADVNAKDDNGKTPLDLADTDEKRRILREAGRNRSSVRISVSANEPAIITLPATQSLPARTPQTTPPPSGLGLGPIRPSRSPSVTPPDRGTGGGMGGGMF